MVCKHWENMKGCCLFSFFTFQYSQKFHPGHFPLHSPDGKNEGDSISDTFIISSLNLLTISLVITATDPELMMVKYSQLETGQIVSLHHIIT